MTGSATTVDPAPAPPTRWTSLVGAGLHAAIAARALTLDADRWTETAARAQVRQARSLLHAARDTVFGRDHDFAGALRAADKDLVRAYRDRVPIADWYAFKDHIAAMRDHAQPDVLWPGLVMDFAQTSGTTAGDKYIPVSREMFRSNFRASLDIFAHLTRFGVSLPRLMGGKCLFLGGSTALDVNRHGIRTGDLSGLVTKLIRWPLSEIYSPGPSIAHLGHWPTKIQAMAQATRDQDIRFISGMPSWALVLFERLMQDTGARSIRELWPHLEVFVHGGVKYTPFERRVRRAWSGDADGPDIPTRLELYPASEGFIAMQDTPGNPGLRLNADLSLFFEFVPLEEIDSSAPCAFTCETVEKGQRYVVVLTTCAGLWRYVLGDVVEFDTIPDNPWTDRRGDGPPRLRIVGRHRHFINAFGENLIVEHVENAVSQAASATGVMIGEFTAAPVYPGEGRRAGLELAIEIEGSPVPGTWESSFRDEFDRALKAQNVDYTTKRTDDLGMSPPTLSPVPKGAFHRWMRSRGKLGGQHKCPRCANHREYLDGVLREAASSQGAP